MELTVLGMNGPFPAANGATSGYLMRGEKTRMVMDMGSGTLGRLTALMPPEKLDALLLSHWHFDHCSDVLPLLFRLQACAVKPLDVYAPVDESSMVRKMVQQNSAFCLHDVQKDDKVQIGEFSVRVFAARHPVPGVMYRVLIKETQGALPLDPSRALPCTCEGSSTLSTPFSRFS